MLVCTVINRMTLDLRSFSKTGGWFASKAVVTDMATVGTMPVLGRRSFDEELTELTLNPMMQYNEPDWKYYEDDPKKPLSGKDQMEYGVHPRAFEEIEMEPRAIYNSPYSDSR